MCNDHFMRSPRISPKYVASHYNASKHQIVQNSIGSHNKMVAQKHLKLAKQIAKYYANLHWRVWQFHFWKKQCYFILHIQFFFEVMNEFQECICLANCHAYNFNGSKHFRQINAAFFFLKRHFIIYIMTQWE